jgi:hypothetical protein
MPIAHGVGSYKTAVYHQRRLFARAHDMPMGRSVSGFWRANAQTLSAVVTIMRL